MLPSSITAMAVFAGADRQHWLPFDWKTVKQLQEAVMKYGVDNKHVLQLLSTFFKNQVLTQVDIRALAELMLPPTAYLLFMDKWERKAEVAVLENIHRVQGDPLRLV